MPKASDQPRRVERVLEGEERLAQLLDRVEDLRPQQVGLRRAREALGAAVALGCPHEGGRTLASRKATSSGKTCDMDWLP